MNKVIKSMKNARKETKLGATITLIAEEMTNASRLRKNHSLMIRAIVTIMKEVVSAEARQLIVTVMQCQPFTSTICFKKCFICSIKRTSLHSGGSTLPKVRSARMVIRNIKKHLSITAHSKPKLTCKSPKLLIPQHSKVSSTMLRAVAVAIVKELNMNHLLKVMVVCMGQLCRILDLVLKTRSARMTCGIKWANLS